MTDLLAAAPAADTPPIPTPPEEHAFVLQVVQPGLLGLMDGSVSTLAPIFATARLTNSAHDAFLPTRPAAPGRRRAAAAA